MTYCCNFSPASKDCDGRLSFFSYEKSMKLHRALIIFLKCLLQQHHWDDWCQKLILCSPQKAPGIFHMIYCWLFFKWLVLHVKNLWTCLFPSLGASCWMEASFGVCCTASKFHFPNLINNFAAIYIDSWILNYFRYYNKLVYDWHPNQRTQQKFRSKIPIINSLFYTSIWS